MKYVTYFLKQTFFPLFYAIIMMFIGLSIKIIGDHLTWLKYLLFALSFVLYAFVIGAISFKEGQESVKIQHSNDVERLNIIRTGEDRPLNLIKEYRVWKGFVSGLVSCFPLIILLLVQAIMLAAGSSSVWPGVIAGYLYLIVFGFFIPGLSGGEPISYYFWNLATIPVLMLLMGFSYMLGARKQQLLYVRVEEKHNYIYGDKN